MLMYCAASATSTGRLCRWRVWPGRPCPHHGNETGPDWDELIALERANQQPLQPRKGYVAARPQEPAPAEPPPAPAPGPAAPGGPQATRQLPGAVLDRDFPEIGWWLLEQCISAGLEPKQITAVVSVIRMMSTFPGGGLTRQEAWDEAYLRGNIANGIPPETEDQWELAQLIYDDDALATLRTWNGLLPGESLERYRRHVDEPLRLVELAREELEAAGLVEDED